MHSVSGRLFLSVHELQASHMSSRRHMSRRQCRIHQMRAAILLREQPRRPNVQQIRKSILSDIWLARSVYHFSCCGHCGIQAPKALDSLARFDDKSSLVRNKRPFVPWLLIYARNDHFFGQSAFNFMEFVFIFEIFVFNFHFEFVSF